jgi:inosine-uridine nucleoside N-ribohydrolase
MDVILVQDAAIDEYMAQVLLTTMPVNLLGVCIVNADCIDTAAMQAAWKIDTFIGAASLPLGLSRARGWNAFPWAYRGDCIKQGKIPALADIADHAAWPPYPDGDALLESLLTRCEPGVTVLVTCPFTPLSNVLRRKPALKQKIGQIVWMGGAIGVGGNLDPSTLPNPPWNGCAEWNAFWDPPSVDWIFRRTTCPIVLFPLDITDRAKITAEFMARLDAQSQAGMRYSTLAHQSYALVSDQPFYDMWDVVTTCWLVNDQHRFFEPPTTMKLAIDVELSATQGCIKPKKGRGGRSVQVVLNFAADGGQQRFYDYVAAQFNRS